ncbi:hypothetical protein [Pedobacter nyackensis]|uniref:hypothetical protein n=1 Tax=Pedobacter nyackensis TaxID=475255 RepID=UPI00292CBFD4|nr:hypothetical protein [Pedobacter nyackensis]
MTKGKNNRSSLRLGIFCGRAKAPEASSKKVIFLISMGERSEVQDYGKIFSSIQDGVVLK